MKQPNGEFVPTTLGEALVHAYNSMNLEYKLSAPQLRAQVRHNLPG